MSRHYPSRILLAAILLLTALPCTSLAQDVLGRSASEWQVDLQSDNPRVRRNAAFAIGRGGNKMLRSFGSLLHVAREDSDPTVKEAAVYALGELGPTNSTDCISLMRKLVLDDKDEKVRRSAAYAIGRYGPHAKAAMGDLEKALKDPSPIVRQNAAWALGKLGQNGGAGDAIPALSAKLSMSNESDPLVRRDAATAISDIGKPAASAAVNNLVNTYRSSGEDQRVRRAALTALVNVVTPEDKNAARELSVVLDEMTRKRASKAGIVDTEEMRDVAFALGNIGGSAGKRAVPILIEALDDPDVVQRLQGAAALSNIGEDAAPALDKLTKGLEDKDPLVRRYCALALSNIGLTAEKAIPALIEHCKRTESDDDARRYCEEAFASIDQKAAEQRIPENQLPKASERAFPALKESITKKDDNWRVRQRAIYATSTIQGIESKPEVVDTLYSVLDETDEETRLVRYEAAVLLGTRLRKNVKDPVLKVLVENLRDQKIKVYKGSSGGIRGGGLEAQGGTNLVENAVGDARWLPAQAVAKIGPRAKDNPDIIPALKFAAQDSNDAKVKEEVDKALRSLGEAR